MCCVRSPRSLRTEQQHYFSPTLQTFPVTFNPFLQTTVWSDRRSFDSSIDRRKILYDGFDFDVSLFFVSSFSWCLTQEAEEKLILSRRVERRLRIFIQFYITRRRKKKKFNSRAASMSTWGFASHRRVIHVLIITTSSRFSISHSFLVLRFSSLRILIIFCLSTSSHFLWFNHDGKRRKENCPSAYMQKLKLRKEQNREMSRGTCSLSRFQQQESKRFSTNIVTHVS